MKFTPDQVEAALIKLQADALPGVTVDALSSSDVDADGNLSPTVRLPASLAFMSQWNLGDGDDNQKVRYASTMAWDLLVGAQNLRTSAQERQSASKLVGDVANAVAGARLAVGEALLPPIAVMSVQPYQFSANGTWYSISIVIEGFVQFDDK